MIWLVMGILVLAVLLFVTQPLYAKMAPQAVQDTELADYLTQIERLEAQIAEGGENTRTLEAAKNDLQRALLASKNKPLGVDTGPSRLLLSSLFVVFSGVVIGLYILLGRPELTQVGALQTLSPPDALNQKMARQGEANLSLEQLVKRLEGRLQKDANTAEGWVLYARSLMSLKRYDEAIIAYNRVVELTDNNSDARVELEQAKIFIAQQSGTASGASGPSVADMEAASQMSEQDRSAMIEDMVEGLSQKLLDNPKDTDGWVRLLRARSVLGQSEQARAEIARMKITFKDEPETITRILFASGWGEEENISPQDCIMNFLEFVCFLHKKRGTL
ncbi:MAG: c-type cytochrome biogenesis protein CcmI [Robiginitomaculum sp.]|nr:MAG: c-type cytochrome biogenesis protein CcmI [Robiginitomaculum sp.]